MLRPVPSCSRATRCQKLRTNFRYRSGYTSDNGLAPKDEPSCSRRGERLDIYMTNNPEDAPDKTERSSRKWAEEMTEAQRLSGRIGIADDGVVITDPRRPDNPIVYANPGFVRLTGYAMEEVMGRNCRFLQGEATDPATIAEVRDGIQAGRETRATLINYRKDGSTFWNQLSISPVRDETGHITHFVGVQADVTDRVRAEHALLLIERAVDAARSGITIADMRLPDAPLVYVNPGFERITGYTAKEVLGLNCRFLQGPDTDPSARTIMQAALRERRDCQVLLRNFRKNGECFWNELSLSPVFDEAGELTHYIGVQNDVTELHQAEEENRRLHAQAHEAAARQRSFLRDILFSVTEGRLRLCEPGAVSTDAPSSDVHHGSYVLPRPFSSSGQPIPLALDSLRVLRRHVHAATLQAGLPDERGQDFIAGVGEASMNAVVHAGGGEASVHVSDNGEVQVWIRDHGKGIAFDDLHRATLERGFTTAGSMGHGFWLMLKTCDACWLATGPQGTTIVLQQGRTPPPPPWLQFMDK